MSGVLSLTHGVRRLLEKLQLGMALIAGWAYLATAAFITLDVLSRAFLGTSSGATTEISGYLLAFGISWSLAHTLAERAHIRIDLMINKFSLGLRAWFHLLALLALAGLVTILCMSAINVLDETLLFNAHDLSALRIPMILPQSLWAIGIFMLALFATVLTLEVVLLLILGRPMEIEDLMRPRNAEDESAEAVRTVQETSR